MIKLAKPKDTIRKRDLFTKRWTWVLLTMWRLNIRRYEDYDFETGGGWSARDIHSRLPEFLNKKKKKSFRKYKYWQTTFNILKRCEEAKTVTSKLCKSRGRYSKRFWWLTDWGVKRAKWLRPRMYARWDDEYPWRKTPSVLEPKK
ncbi:hypothetical protein AKJ56_01755 [candidate division MSBL1 archaeon SCGC-AAA382N08]|uniref:Uncharacterized protein n=1 Tax=candidate division MSBL1 archaeon SCGC-AAA382N08 TaxID=1698285 RepID=A0A133VNX9_9EURY|nr:hypothetical protein AKJ56_01755 [candidate division MSBL1 archaeon SCGC-AAA382N08]